MGRRLAGCEFGNVWWPAPKKFLLTQVGQGISAPISRANPNDRNDPAPPPRGAFTGRMRAAMPANVRQGSVLGAQLDEVRPPSQSCCATISGARPRK